MPAPRRFSFETPRAGLLEPGRVLPIAAGPPAPLRSRSCNGRSLLSVVEEIWEFIAQDNIDAADRVREEIFAACEKLAEIPGMDHLREDLAP